MKTQMDTENKKTGFRVRHGMTNRRNQLLAALFSQAKKKGIESEELRDVIAPNIIRKRLSKASLQEIVRVIEHLAGKNSNEQRVMSNERQPWKYKSSRAGLIEELTDVAKERWGEDFEKSLNAFINSHLKVRTHYKFLGVTFLKGIKERLKEMNEQREIASPLNDSIRGSQ